LIGLQAFTNLMTSDCVACGEAQDRERIERGQARIRHARQHISAIGAAELTADLAGG
jgi:hypothetical protein